MGGVWCANVEVSGADEATEDRETDMKKNYSLTAVVEKEDDGYVSLCPELDVASQGDTVEEATANLKEAVELFLACASPKEIRERLHEEVFVTRFEAAYA